MKILKGIGCSSGVAVGKTLVLSSAFLHYPRTYLQKTEEVETEKKRLINAQKTVENQISNAEASSNSDLARELLPFLNAHRLVLYDKRLVPSAIEQITEKKINAEWALIHTLRIIEKKFKDIVDPYIRSRFDDVRQVAEKLMGALQKKKRLSLDRLPRNTILICQDISPAESFILGQGKVSGIGMEFGGINSHTAIICRALNIPLVAGLKNITGQIGDGKFVIIDSGTGEFICDPDPLTLQEKNEKKQRLFSEALARDSFIDKETVLKDGKKVPLEANLDFMEEILEIKKLRINRIGLIRSEFFFMDHLQAPNEEEQYVAYNQIFSELEDREVTMRTWDLGADKTASFFPAQHHEENPSLGLRAVRIYQKEEEFFRTQLRAIIRGSQNTLLRILIPMITNVGEMLHARKLIDEECLKMSCKRSNILVGSMIETPAAAIIIDELLQISDFISVGSNDLVQYTLAIDRNNEYVSDMYSPFHPAVLQLLQKIINSANLRKIPVSICGEIASDPIMQMLLIGIGNITFSMSPNQILLTRQFLKTVTESTCKKIAFRFLSNRMLVENQCYIKELREEHPELHHSNIL